MDSQVLQFLSENRVGVLAAVLPDDSSHAAALHYSFIDSPFLLLFSTNKTSRKAIAVAEGREAQASVVIGFSEDEWKSLQLDGNLSIISDEAELERIKPIHYAKHPRAQQFEHDPDTIFVKFEPTWWRYTDFNADPPMLLSSV